VREPDRERTEHAPPVAAHAHHLVKLRLHLL
jgi:hypothetical protein